MMGTLHWPGWVLLSALVLYADRPGTDVVMDAPWRTVRDYVPILVFTPQFHGGRRVEAVRVVEWVGGARAGAPVFVDRRDGPDTLSGATFVGPLGESRGGLTADERVGDFWHYVVRLPHAALRAHATPDVHDLLVEVEWTRPGVTGRTTFRNTRVLRVLVQPEPFPSLDALDRYYDVHAHTIAEQTTSGVLDVNGASKAFGGPVVMLLESAYALGVVQTQPRDGNWAAFRDSVAITDHNIFYSRKPYDTAARPPVGPTASATDGAAGEGAWYRAHLGTLAGEEITLRRGSNQDGKMAPNIGHHLLAYGTRHVEGPWHGGLFLTSRLENPNTLEAVLRGVKAAGADGFVYASHPDLEGFVWPPEYFAQAIGLPPYDSREGPAVDSAGTDFVFKGSEVWNTKYDLVARGSGRLETIGTFDHMNPFEGGPAAQRFETRPWDAELARALDRWYGQLGRGLSFAFREAPSERFVRKLYVSAGSDAHGDFDYSDEVTATVVPYSGLLHGNAWARVRTYALAHDRAAGARNSVDALRDGNTVLTDGPLFMYHLDADARHDPGAGPARWHDATVAYENPDGAIGGAGAFDGGRTVLVPEPGDEVWIRSVWMRSATPGASDIARLAFVRVTEAGRDSFEVVAGAEGAPDTRRLPRALDRLSALVASARDTAKDERCIANPVWVAPVRIEVTPPPSDEGSRPDIAFPPRGLKVAFHFPFSMSGGGARVFLRPLDANGVSTDPEIELVPDPGWQDDSGMAKTALCVTNADAVPCPAADWDAETHARVPGAKSFVVYVVAPADLHGNVLNDVARAFTIRRR